ncbi:hypothetical protein AURDEDRAFT_128812 [Auricularia subglabra TFB-10046 SS5]|nr:hypothetical protein AURDEDRAFT_128812 [Auricularia subglabra TFB-10046 SS5]
MDGTSGAVGLPDDVLRLILDNLEVCQLLVAARVSRAWRAVALAHPVYSRKVALYLTTHSPNKHGQMSTEISFFCRRLASPCSSGNIVSLELYLNFRPSMLASLDVDWALPFQAARACMERLDFLCLRVNESLLSLARALLNSPAPRLVEFRLGIHECSKPSRRRALTNRLFSGDAPRLQRLRLDGWAFTVPLVGPPGTGTTNGTAVPISALSHVTELRLQLNWSYPAQRVIHLERFFVHCPRIERLVLRGGYSTAFLHRGQSWAALPRPDALNLRHVSLLGDVVPDLQTSAPDPEIEAWKLDVTAVVRGLGHAQMETLEVNTIATTTPTLMLILSHFGTDPLHFDASTGSGEYLRVTVRSLARPCTRTLVHMLSYTDQVDAPMFQRCLAQLAANIVRLTVHRTLTAWHFVSEIFECPRRYIGVLPNVRRLSVVLGYVDGEMREDDDRYSMQSHAGHCCFHLGVTSLDLPALECVELVGPAEDPLYAEDVALLMGKGLRRTARRNLVLVLNNIQIEGDPGLIWGYFERIELHSSDT